MDRTTIISRFRGENSDITIRAIPDNILQGWCLDGDKDVCAFTKCIVSNTPEIISSVEDVQYYDLSAHIDKFYEIDEYPGGGVWYDDEPLTKCSEAEMNYILRNWKTADSGTPRKYFRRGKYLWFDVAPDTDDVEIAVSTVYISDDFDEDGKTPYNGLTYLEPYHPAIMKYLQWKAMVKIGKDQEALMAEKEYYTFIKRMSKLITGSQNSSMFLVPRSSSGHTK